MIILRKRYFFSRNCFLTAGLFIYMHSLPAQTVNRNQQVRTLNTIVEFMDEASRLDQQMYYDILSFCRAYALNLKKKNNNIWDISVSASAKLKSGDFSLYEELHPDAEGFINDYESRMLPCIRARMDLKNKVAKFPVKDAGIRLALKAYENCFDSMLYRYKQLVDYVHHQLYKQDDKNAGAKQIISNLQPWFELYNQAAGKLYLNIQHYYTASLPPLKSQAVIRNAQKELLLSVDVIDKWAAELYRGDNSRRVINDSLLRLLNKEGRPKAAAYLQQTYGYNRLSNGAYPHSRYDMFFGNMPATIFWYIGDTVSNNELISRGHNNYNKYVNRYNSVIHYYNEFIECADGQAFANNIDYSLKMAGETGVDTAQNVLLKKPRLAYQFALVVPADENDDYGNIKQGDSIEQRRRELIRSADPHHTVYLLDVSNSMKEEHKLDTLKEAMKYLVKLQRPVDNISVIAFADSAETIMRFTPCDEKKSIYKNIDKLETSGATNAEDAVLDGYKLVDSTQQYKGKTKIVIITDGQFTLEKPTKKKIEAYQKAGVHLSILLLGSIHDIDTIEYFQMLCAKGNGNFYDMRQNNLMEVLVKEASN